MRLDESGVASKDALAEASEILQEPSRDTKRRVLISVNVIVGLAFVFHVFTQLATKGQLPDPQRDLVLYPSLILFNFGSAAYNLHLLFTGADGTRRLNAITQWGSVILLQVLCLVIVHANANRATSLLLDHSVSIVTIFLTGLILNRGAALLWTAITLVSLVFAVKNMGVGFEYVLMTQDEVAALTALQKSDPAAYAARMHTAELESLKPLPIMLYAQVSAVITFTVLAATFFQAGMLSKVLSAMPKAVQKIQIAARATQRLAQENIRMGMELDVAQRIQAMVLPRPEELQANETLEISARMQSANEVGGDLYDVLHGEDGTTCFVIGDVTDHGLASGVIMLMSQAALRTSLEGSGFNLVQTLNHVNSILYKNVQERMLDQRNMTLALLSYKDGVVRLAGQHEEVLVVRADTGEVESFDTMDLGFMVGMIDDIEEFTAEVSFELHPGDLMLLYTDGATEAERADKEMFGRDRLIETLKAARERPTDEILDHLFSTIHAWIGDAELLDDITLVLVRRTASAVAPRQESRR